VREGLADRDHLLLALVENLQRRDLTVLEEAEAYRHLREDFGLTQEDIAERVGKDRATVANTLRLLKLPAAVRAALEKGTLTAVTPARCSRCRRRPTRRSWRGVRAARPLGPDGRGARGDVREGRAEEEKEGPPRRRRHARRRAPAAARARDESGDPPPASGGRGAHLLLLRRGTDPALRAVHGGAR